MKRLILLIAGLLIISSAGSCQKPTGYVIDKPDPVPVKPKEPETPSEPDEPSEGVFVGYVTYWDKTMPDLQYITHLNYSFGHVASSFDKVDVKNPNRLRTFVSKKKDYPGLKIILSVGGWGAGNFSEMAADEKLRKKFCASCLEACKTYGLDGIDLDWEYPTSSSAGISSSPDDTKNFTLLLRDMREAIGKDRLLTMASASNAKYVDFRAAMEYLDFVNIMTYDMGRPPKHNAGLYKSSMTHESCDESVARHFKAGVPYSRMTLGVPFYGKKLDEEDSVDYNEIDYTGLTRAWDALAKAPYLVDASGKMILSYDDAESVALKGKYAKEKKLLGVMVWNLEADDSSWTLAKSLHDGFFSE